MGQLSSRLDSGVSHWNNGTMGTKASEPGRLSQELARILTNHRLAQGISENELAKKCGVPQTTLNKLLAGRRPFYVDQLEAISDSLGLVAWKVMREAESAPTLSVVPDSLEGLDETDLAAHTGDKETDQ